MIKLHLFQEIQYQRAYDDLELDSCYASVIAGMFSIPIGSEICLAIDYSCDDFASFKLLLKAEKDPPTPEEKDAADNGLPLPPIQNPAFQIESGTYSFEQLAELPAPGRLHSFLYRYCTAQQGVLLLRLMRENAVEFVAQVLVKG